MGIVHGRSERRGLQLRVDRPQQRQVHDPGGRSGYGTQRARGPHLDTWFNQPTGQMYNVTTDHGFPFFMYSAQQDSGTIATPIFGRGGQITYRDWYTTNGFETAHILADPTDPNYLYATGWYGALLRINKVTGQAQHIFERTP